MLSQLPTSATSAQLAARQRALVLWVRALVVYALLLGVLVTATRMIGTTEADSATDSAADSAISPITDESVADSAADSSPNSATDSLPNSAADPSADPSPNSAADPSADPSPNSAAPAGDLPDEQAQPDGQAQSDGQAQPREQTQSGDQVPPSEQARSGEGSQSNEQVPPNEPAQSGEPAQADGQAQSDGQAQAGGQVPPTEPIQSGDPVSTWPDPINESQLGSEAVYYHYARADGRSLLRTPTPDNPLRVWVGGDSMAGGPSFGLDTLLGDNPNYEITSEIRKSTGNVADWYFDWPLHMTNEVSEAGYDVIVLSVGANDKQKFRGLGSDAGEPAWLERYQAAAMSLLNAATRPGRLVVWVGLPHMRPAWLHGFPDIVNPVFRDAVAQLDDAFYVDAAAILTPGGTYVRRLGGEHGDRNVRTADGVHYTFYGGELVSLPIVAEIERRFS